jgi:tetratricopeptide (TPR) repeat protein
MQRRLGKTSEAIDLLRVALAMVSDIDEGAAAYACRNLAQAEVEQDNLAVAEAYFDRALALARRSKSRRREAQVLFYHGMLQLKLDRPRRAERLLLEVSTLVQELGDLPGQIQTLRGLALCHEAAGDITAAESTLLGALQLASQPFPTLMETTVREELDRIWSCAQPNAETDIGQ